MENRTAKDWLFSFLLLFTLLPLLQQCFHIVESGPLLGFFYKNPDINFSFDKWWDGTYQKRKTLFVNDSVGFRPDLVRMADQINCTFFKKLPGDDAYIGRDHYLFSREYVEEYEGRTNLDIAIIRDEIRKLKCIQDTMDRMGKTFVFIYAPSKPYIFPDKIPAVLRAQGEKKVSSYTVFKRLSDSFHIRQLDFNALFMSMKNTVPLIYTKQGCHWSIYGSALAADSMVKYIERERKIEMPELGITNLRYTDTPRSSDNDLASSVNLIWPITKETFCYPEFHYSVSDAKTKPKTIFIGDSFLWAWVEQGLMQHTTTQWEYWYYFRDVYDQNRIGNMEPEPMDKHNWPKALMDADCVLAVFTPMNIPRLADSSMFIEKMYNYFYRGQK